MVEFVTLPGGIPDMGVWYIAAAHPHVNHTPKTENPQGAKLLVNPTTPTKIFALTNTPSCVILIKTGVFYLCYQHNHQLRC